MSKPKRALGLSSRTPRRILIIHGPIWTCWVLVSPASTERNPLPGSTRGSLASPNARGLPWRLFKATMRSFDRTRASSQEAANFLDHRQSRGADSHKRGVTRCFGSGRDSVSRGTSVEHLLQRAVPAPFVLFRPRGGYDLRTRQPGVRVRAAVRLALKLRAWFGVACENSETTRERACVPGPEGGPYGFAKTEKAHRPR